jgi:predicted PurR-regulated permease PerM
VDRLGGTIKLILGGMVFACFVWFVYAVRGILGPFVLAFVLAYILEPLVDRLEGRGIGRTLSIVFIFIAVIGTAAFGLVRLGDNLSEEIVGLTESFLLKEQVERTLVVTNSGDENLVLNTRWAPGVIGEQPFDLIDPPMPVTIAPGNPVELVLRFAPTKRTPIQTRVLLWGDTTQEEYLLYLRGNSEKEEATTDKAAKNIQDFWKDRAEVPRSMGPLSFSAKGLDFGAAGPSIPKLVGEYLKGVQPMLQSYLGQDFNLSGLIREHGRSFVQTVLGSTTDVLGGVVSGITYLVLVPFVTFFFLREGGNILHSMIEWVPNAYFELVLNLIHQVNGQIGGYIRGQLLAVSVVATLAVVGLSLIQMQYALVIGILAGLANMIPYLGPLIGIFTAGFVALASGGGLALVSKVVIVFLAIQLIDNLFIQPTIIAKSVNLHPLVVLFAVMVGNQLGGGIVGMLLAVPVAGILKVSIQTFYQGFRAYRTR